MKKTKKNEKKLVLKKEAVAKLDMIGMEKVYGGEEDICTGGYPNCDPENPSGENKLVIDELVME